MQPCYVLAKVPEADLWEARGSILIRISPAHSFRLTRGPIQMGEPTKKEARHY